MDEANESDKATSGKTKAATAMAIDAQHVAQMLHFAAASASPVSA